MDVPVGLTELERWSRIQSAGSTQEIGIVL